MQKLFHIKLSHITDNRIKIPIYPVNTCAIFYKELKTK